MKFTPQKMVGWYDAIQLLKTGVKTVISSTLGNYADRRELQAALHKENKHYDLSNHFGDEVWFDFVSDLGDGFNATYTVAHLIGKGSLTLNKTELKRGDLVIMGGDQVYPTPEMEEYNNRFRGPYKAAFPNPDDENYWRADPKNPKKRVKNDPKEYLQPIERPPFLFAIPGNHDWYDGLNNFIKIFTQKRRLGNWQTLQDRSYFAIRLPHNVWIWGTDVQLHSDIDEPQLNYFLSIARAMEDNSKIILCTAEPAWVFKALENNEDSLKRLNYFESTFIKNETGKLDFKNEAGQTIRKKHKLIATLTGDLHHYSHYCTKTNGKLDNHRITAGGGGAFLHPTHNLPSQIKELKEGTLQLEGNPYPDQKTSRKLLFRNFAFLWHSPQFALVMAFLYVFFAWVMWKYTGIGQKMGVISDPELRNFGFFVKSTIWELIIPSVIVCYLIYLFTDVKSAKNKLVVQLFGWGHGLYHLTFLYLMIWFLSKELYNFYWPQVKPDTDFEVFYRNWSIAFVFNLTVFGGVAGTLIMGGYLYFANRIFGIHITEAFSGLAIEDYKNFLRIHVTKTKVLIYPIGIDKVTKNWRNYNTVDFPLFKGKRPVIHIINKKPIEIDITQ